MSSAPRGCCCWRLGEASCWLCSAARLLLLPLLEAHLGGSPSAAPGPIWPALRVRCSDEGCGDRTEQPPAAPARAGLLTAAAAAAKGDRDLEDGPLGRPAAPAWSPPLPLLTGVQQSASVTLSCCCPPCRACSCRVWCVARRAAAGVPPLDWGSALPVLMAGGPAGADRVLLVTGTKAAAAAAEAAEEEASSATRARWCSSCCSCRLSMPPVAAAARPTDAASSAASVAAMWAGDVAATTAAAAGPDGSLARVLRAVPLAPSARSSGRGCHVSGGVWSSCCLPVITRKGARFGNAGSCSCCCAWWPLRYAAAAAPPATAEGCVLMPPWKDTCWLRAPLVRDENDPAAAVATKPLPDHVACLLNGSSCSCCSSDSS